MIEEVEAEKTPIHPKALDQGSVVIVGTGSERRVVAGLDALRAARDRGETTVGAYIIETGDPESLIELLAETHIRGFLWPKLR